jgi:hypothetical protein
METTIYGIKILFRLDANDVPNIEIKTVTVSASVSGNGCQIWDDKRQPEGTNLALMNEIFANKKRIMPNRMDCIIDNNAGMPPALGYMNFVVYSYSREKARQVIMDFIDSKTDTDKFRADRMKSFWEEQKERFEFMIEQAY